MNTTSNSSPTRPIAIFGAGGLGREMAGLIAAINTVSAVWDFLGFYDDVKTKGEMIDNEFPVLGGMEDINSSDLNLNLVIGVGDPSLKKKIISRITNMQILFPVLIHPSAIPGNLKNNSFGKGTLLTAGVILTTHVQLGEFVTVNLGTTIGHDVHIGSFSSVMPGCNISGNVTIGASSNIGTGTKILQNILLGDNTITGAGAVITKSFGNDTKLIGIPAQNLKTEQNNL